MGSIIPHCWSWQCCVALPWETWKKSYWYLTLVLDIKYRKWLKFTHQKDNQIYTANCNYHECWSLDDASRRGTSSHDIDLVCLENSAYRTKKFTAKSQNKTNKTKQKQWIAITTTGISTWQHVIMKYTRRTESHEECTKLILLEQKCIKYIAMFNANKMCFISYHISCQFILTEI